LNQIFLIVIISLLLIGFGNYALAESFSDPAVILKTSLGEIVISFFPYDAPEHVKNFLILSQNGFYNDTLFHRVIPGFMIQGGDPNTIDGDPNSWGQGGPDEKLDAEFNSIKHNRGIVSMARSQDPNSAGSQFFIVHKDSNFLDGEYTVFGRIVTEESFQTLDKIAAVQTGTSDRPINAEQVKIIKVSVTNISEIPNILELSDPERIEFDITQPIDNQIFESKVLDVKFSAPAGWLLQQPTKSSSNSPDVAVVGPKVSGVNPVISLTIESIGEKSFDDLIIEKNNNLAESVYLNQLEILSQKKIKSNVYQTEAIGIFPIEKIEFQIKFLEVMILKEQILYTFVYSNSINNFENELPKFNESLSSFKIPSQESSIMKSSEKESTEGGGCLIATAAYGSEMAPQVQLLREIRDNQLMNTESGSTFMTGFNELYYTFSPTIADMERESPMFKEAVKISLTPLISSLSILNYVDMDSESEVLGYGISLILLNLGMYLGLPAIVVVGIKKRK
jgi:peptidyl-prolyl cis-trans isomerase B (cyclophilin B)